MKVVLSADVQQLGRKGDVVEVAPGYARNYLLPKKLAIPATRGAVGQAEVMRRARLERENRERLTAQSLAARIATTPLRITARAGEEGHLFGSVTTADIAEKLAAALGQEIDRRRIHLHESIRSLGVHDFSVHLHQDVTAAGTIEVVAER